MFAACEDDARGVLYAFFQVFKTICLADNALRGGGVAIGRSLSALTRLQSLDLSGKAA